MATFERHEGRNLKGIDPDAKDRDLEQYGVWVKAEPQDILEEPDSEPLTLLAEDSDLESVDEVSFLTDEEEVFLGAGSTSPGNTAKGKEASPSSSGIPSLHEDELSIPDLEEESFGEQEDLPKMPDMAELESMEDLGVPIEEFTPDTSSRPAAPSRSPAEFQDVSDFGLEDEEPSLAAGSETDFEAIDIDLKFDDTLPPRPAAQGGKVSRESPAADNGFETVTDFDDFLNDPEVQNTQRTADSAFEQDLPRASKSPASEDDFSLEDIPELPGEVSIDDMAELEKDLSDSGPVASQRPDASSDILSRIAVELSSIKQELVFLKSQIAAMKSAAASASDETEETGKPGSGKAGGFFDEEEDETIALTGDELDNILNTAEFSEGNAQAESGLEELESSEDFEDLLPETGDYSSRSADAALAGEPGIEELRVPPDESLASLAKIGVAPQTPAPEDTSYLEENLEEPEELQLANEDELPEAPLLEPTPEELDIEDLVEERFEDAEELPLADFESTEDLDEPADLLEEAEELEELTLELDSEDSPLVLESPDKIDMPLPEMEEAAADTDGFAVEFVEELPGEDEPDKFGEIPLHQEDAPIDEAPDSMEFAELEAVDDADENPSESLLVEDLEPDQASKPEPIPNRIKDEVRSVLTYLDKLLESLPEEKIEEFAKSEHFETYKRLFEELGLV